MNKNTKNEEQNNSENLSSWFGRIEPSQFEVYADKYKDIMSMTRRNGIIEVRMHTDRKSVV